MLRKSSNSAKIKFFKLNYDEVMERLKHYAEKIVKKGAKLVILIGSLARGDYTAFSDADVLIISDGIPKRPIDRLKEYIDPSMPIDVEPRVYTTKEVIQMALKKAKIIIEALTYGKVLAGNSGFLEEIKEAMSIRNIIEKAIEEYNKYRAPEVEASLVYIGDQEFKVKFSGSFCYTCGFYDYFDDLKIELEDLGLKTEIKEIEEIPEGAIVTFTVKR
ncbi:MAG: nucleotidyltransferase domain-containing protein [Candidatus Nezhaarchaeales archaeon]